MASAWEQAAEIQQVNQRMRQLQMSMAVGESLHARHLSVLSEEQTLRFASPAFSRIRVPAGDSVVTHAAPRSMARTSLPVPATRRRDAAHRPSARPADATNRGAGLLAPRRRARGLRASISAAQLAPSLALPSTHAGLPAFRRRSTTSSIAIWNSGFSHRGGRTAARVRCPRSIRCRRRGTTRDTSAPRRPRTCRASAVR